MNKYIIQQVTIGSRILLFSKLRAGSKLDYSKSDLETHNYRFGGQYILVPGYGPIHGMSHYYVDIRQNHDRFELVLARFMKSAQGHRALSVY